jgi:hypothetical protein
MPLESFRKGQRKWRHDLTMRDSTQTTGGRRERGRERGVPNEREREKPGESYFFFERG